MDASPAARPDQVPHAEQSQAHQGGGGSGEQAHVKEVYEPRLYLSLVLKCLPKRQAAFQESSTAEGTEAAQSCYKTLFLDKLLKYESLDELAKGIDKQLSGVEDEVIELIRAREERHLERPPSAAPNMIEYGSAILNLMKEDIKPLLVVVGDLKDLHVSKMIQAHQARGKAGVDSKMLETMTRLSYKDTKLIAINLNDCNTGDGMSTSSHLCDLKFLCFITQGRYFSFDELCKLNQKCIQNSKSEQCSQSKSALSR